MKNSILSNLDIHSLILNKLEKIQEMVLNKQKPFLDVDETSAYLKLSKNTLYGYTSRGILPYFKVQNRKLYFRIEDLNEFVLNKKKRVESIGEIENDAITKIVAQNDDVD